MLHSPLFFVWIGWVVVIGVIAVVRGIYARREEAELEQRRAEHASRRVGRTQHPVSLPQRHSLPPDYRQHLLRAIPPDRAYVPDGELTLARTPDICSGVSSLSRHHGLRAGA